MGFLKKRYDTHTLQELQDRQSFCESYTGNWLEVGTWGHLMALRRVAKETDWLRVYDGID